MPPAAASPLHRAHRLGGWRSVALWPAALLIRLWGATLRFEVSAATEAQLRRKDRPVAFVLWHNRIFLAAEVYRRYRDGRPLRALISASQDGAWLTAFFSLLGMKAARGSSSRGGRAAADAVVEALRSGEDAGITPDGPRGPCYVFKPGAWVVARAAGAPILLVSCRYSAGWRLKTWDGFWLPRPFCTVQIVCEEAPPEWLDGDRDAAAARLERRLRELTRD